MMPKSDSVASPPGEVESMWLEEQREQCDLVVFHERKPKELVLVMLARSKRETT